MRMILTPPVLPPFLAGTYDLKPVEGVPSDEEVKIVHAAIRGLDDVANVPILYDANLAMRLAMHLFSVQMARYRDKHPCIIFPSNTTHTPPPLPAHIPVKLEPITGPPSDKQIKSVQAALRLSENLANVPLMFDADLSMKLSQHLFDIQFERYLHRITDGDPSAPATSSRAENANVNDSGDVDPPGAQNDPTGRGREQGDRDVSTIETAVSGSIQESTEVRSRDPVSWSDTAARNTLEPLEPIQAQPKQSLAESLKVGLEDTNKVLVEVRNGLKDVKQVLIVTQQSMARGLNRTAHSSGLAWPCSHTLLNEDGEEPHNLGIRNLRYSQLNLINGRQVQDSDIARCLLFYGLAKDFIGDGDELTIKEGKRDAARAELRSFFGS